MEYKMKLVSEFSVKVPNGRKVPRKELSSLIYCLKYTIKKELKNRIISGVGIDDDIDLSPAKIKFSQKMDKISS